DTNRARESRQRALARYGEPTCRLEARFKSREPLVERAGARQADRLDVELEFAAGFVDRRHGPNFDLLPASHGDIEELCLLAVKNATDLGPVVLEHEVRVTGRGARAVRYFPADQGEAQLALDQQVGRTHQERDRYHRGSGDAPIAHG